MAKKTLGQVGYEAYNMAKGGLTYDGKPIPAWDALTGEVGLAVQSAWEVAARAAADEMTGRWAPGGWIYYARRAVEAGPMGRERALALTKLDEAAMWHAAIPQAAP